MLFRICFDQQLLQLKILLLEPYQSLGVLRSLANVIVASPVIGRLGHVHLFENGRDIPALGENPVSLLNLQNDLRRKMPLLPLVHDVTVSSRLTLVIGQFSQPLDPENGNTSGPKATQRKPIAIDTSRFVTVRKFFRSGASNLFEVGVEDSSSPTDQSEAQGSHQFERLREECHLCRTLYKPS